MGCTEVKYNDYLYSLVLRRLGEVQTMFQLTFSNYEPVRPKMIGIDGTFMGIGNLMGMFGTFMGLLWEFVQFVSIVNCANLFQLC